MSTHILVVDDEPTITREICEALTDSGYAAEAATSARAALELAGQTDFDVMITDLNMPEMNGLELIERVKEMSPATHVIVLTAHGTLDSAIEALRLGAFDYIQKPARLTELLAKIDHLRTYKRMETDLQLIRRELTRVAPRYKLFGESSGLQEVRRLIDKVAPTHAPVLITGESGTGKELVAHAIHGQSGRQGAPFVAINCAAIPENLLESELFGHTRGAFTGAVAKKEGLLRAAGKGTIFLDEISQMQLALQAKMLRVIENKEVTPVGSTQVLPVQARLIAATNRDLNNEVENRRFQEDLYYRLAVVEIHIAPLRERREDIPVIVESILARVGSELRGRPVGITNEALRLLVGYDWKGNVRELENVIERAIILGEGELITPVDLPVVVQKTMPMDPGKVGGLKEATHHFERQYIQRVIEAADGDKHHAADLLQISLSTLYRKLDELGMKSTSGAPA